MLLGSLFLLLAILPLGPVAQDLPLTNCGVIALLETQAEPAVMAEIWESIPMFDLSPPGESSLRNQGVSEAVIEAMRAAQQRSPDSNGESLSGLPCESGYYFKSDTGWIQTDPFQLPKFKPKLLWTFATAGFVSKTERHWRGEKADLTIPHAQPTLYHVTKGSVDRPGMRAPRQGHIRIIRLKSKKSKRVVSCTSRNRLQLWPDCPYCEFGRNNGFAAFIQIAQRVKMITPLSRLKPGEYWLHRCTTEDSPFIPDTFFGIRIGEHVEAEVKYDKPIKKR